MNEILQGFASQCVLVVDGAPWPTRLEDGHLVAEGAPPAAHEFEVVLKTPEPRRPREVHGAPDDRLLGIALEAE